ncbi:MAG: dihydroorotate dehydrogenase [Synergistaceae bacterium]|jgi:dihydroorotate dehydrogenase (NAD+) catalytic subunit|nr:dihydroorotate dehydrogenase [Synergistaceae bacterium]
MTFDISVKVGDLNLSSPVIPASGVWPYDIDFWQGDKLSGIGAICTKAISFNPKEGNKGIRLWETPAGVLNSIGLQNIGVHAFVEQYRDMLHNCEVPVVANVVMEREEETAETLRILQDMGGIAVAELNISCPNVDGDGMAWGMEPCSAAKAVSSVRKAWNGNLWVKMTPQAADLSGVAKAIEDEGADALVVANTWLGMGMDLTKAKPAFDRVVAGLSGPAIFPLALRQVWQVSDAVDIPIVGCGGVTTAADCMSMILAGASAVEVGTGFFKDIKAGEGICSDLPKFMKRYESSSLNELVGKAKKNKK